MNSATRAAFSTLSISKTQLDNLRSLGYLDMTPVQAKSLPVILDGRDLIARAKTGSGKTAAFGIGLLEKLNPRFFGTQVLVLCPTRELADQVGRELRRLAQATANVKVVLLVGGKPFGPQKASLAHGAHVVVGTPGRVLDHLQKGTLRLTGLTALVLDEADRMLDMGFADSMQQIVERTPSKRQTLLFSATYPDAIAQMSRQILKDPITVTVESVHQPDVIEQIFYQVHRHDRQRSLLALFEHYQPASALVFCQTKVQCAEIARFLSDHSIESAAIHGDLEQRERDQVMVRFGNGSCPVLVATDVAARGIDVPSLQMVINYELPRDPEVYVHRIGRTGRAGASGVALSLYTEAEQVRLNAIEKYLSAPCICDVPESLDHSAGYTLAGTMATIEINAGRKQKFRPGDLLGALTGDAGLSGAAIGRIDIFDARSFVAVDRRIADQALHFLNHGRVKGRSIRARRVD